ncbi:MAG: hypothetical protein M5U26_08955 [Planctomycetota bacterium]|nr:hypothetical protein [Planctomycetota bacterium]
MTRARLRPLALALLLVLGFSSASARAGEGDEVGIVATVAQGSDPGKNTDDPEVDAQLRKYKRILKGFLCGKYAFVGKDQAKAKVGQTVTLKAGPYTLDVTLAEKDEHSASVNVVVKEGEAEIGKGGLKLKGGPSVIQLKEPKAPLIVLVERQE